MYRGPYTFWRTYYAKARILNLVTLAYRVGAPLYIGAPMQQKHVESNMLGHMPYALYVCQAAGASINGGGAPS